MDRKLVRSVGRSWHAAREGKGRVPVGAESHPRPKAEPVSTTLSRLALVDPALATGKAKDLLEGVQRQLGAVPNFLRVLANSPAALGGFLELNGALHAGRLERTLTERIALLAAESNGCQYCVSAHTTLAEQAGLEQAEIEAARRGTSSEPRADAAVRFAKAVLDNKGDGTNAELDALRDAGFDDGQVAELIAQLALNTLTNYVGKVGQIDIDWPEVALFGQGAGQRSGHVD